MSNKRERRTKNICANCGNDNVKFILKAFEISQFKRLKKKDVVILDGPEIYIPEFDLSLKPDVVQSFGDLFCYWTKQKKVVVKTCSRICSISYAIRRNSILFYETTTFHETSVNHLIGFIASQSITPHQELFDKYAKKNCLEAYLDTLFEDQWDSEEDELRALINARFQDPNRLFRLANTALGRSEYQLAEQAINKLINDFPVSKIIDQTCILLGRINKPKDADELYENLRKEVGGYENMHAVRLSNWALVIVVHDPQKALRLSAMALQMAPDVSLIFTNHMIILAMSSAIEETLTFVNENAHRINSHNGFFTAGQIYLKAGDYKNSLDYLRTADQYNDDPQTKRYLAEALIKTENYADALMQVRNGLSRLENSGEGKYTDASGTQVTLLGFGYSEKKYLRKAFLAMEGEILLKMGERQGGIERIRDAIDINYASEEEVFKNLDKYLQGYKPRYQLEQVLISQQRLIAEFTKEIDNYRIQVVNLDAIIEAIAKTQECWSRALSSLKEETLRAGVEESFASRIHTYSILLRTIKSKRYYDLFDLNRNKYQFLPTKVIEIVAIAKYIYEQLGLDNDAPVFASVIIEFSKALEIAVNMVIIEPLGNVLIKKGNDSYLFRLNQKGKKPFVVQLIKDNRVKQLMLAEQTQLLKSEDTVWLNYLNMEAPTFFYWINIELPQVLLEIKNSYRNSCAHESTANRERVEALVDYLDRSRVFDNLNSICELKK